MLVFGMAVLLSIVLCLCFLVVSKSNVKSIHKHTVVVVMLAVLLVGCTSTTDSPSTSKESTTEQTKNTEQKTWNETEAPQVTEEAASTGKVEGNLEVHFIDVGQGAAQVVTTPNNKVMVIDGGNNDDEDRMVSYLTQLGVKKIDILIGTHPDADHIGGIDAVIDSFDIGKIYMPKIQSNTKTFESVLQSIRNKGLKVTTAQKGINLELDSTVQAKMIAPISTTSDTNEMSAIVRLAFGEQSFLLPGDAGIKTEKDLIASGETLASTVLLVGHHGSKYSTSEAFIQAVQPKYGVIQVGKNNYGHPEDEVLSRLANHKVNIYRTDTDGTIIFKTNGKTIEVNKSAWKYAGNSQSMTHPSTKQQESSASEAKPITAVASIDNPNPGQNESVTVTVTVKDQDGKAVNGANVHLKLHYKSTDTVYNGVTNANGIATINFKTGRPAKGFTVNGEITVTANGQSTNTSTAFTPQ